jgi:hypothetical protein
MGGLIVRTTDFVATARPFHRQHNNAEHLTLMERCVGTFPAAMLDKSKVRG